jgi:DNA invertase Pin-like site-specific DNA recombinase
MMATKVIPVLGAARLSIETDESTSIERQTAGIEGWVTLRGQVTGDDYRLIKVTVDSDVSGAVNPFDREGLGPYLRKPLLDTWEVLVIYRLDRLTRSIADFEELWKFLEANGKTLVSVAENIDFGTPTGRLMARQLVLFAEYEREMIRARVKAAYDALQAKGRYAGMQFPFGYIPVKLPGKGWGFEHHPRYADVVEDLADRLIAGEALSALCRWLDENGIPTPRNAVREYGNIARVREGKKPLPLKAAHWDTTSLVKILRSPTIIGEFTTNGETYRDETGMAIKRAEPLIPREKWEKVKAILADNAAHMGPKLNISPLLRVAYCDQCKGPLYSHGARPSKAGRKYRYYVCVNMQRKRGCTARRIDADTLESLVSHALLAQMGWIHLKDEVEIPGMDYSTQMAELAEAIGALASRIALGRAHGQDVSKFEEQQRIHEANLTRLAEEPTRLPETKEVDTGETWADRWNRLDWNGRNELLRRKGVKFYVERDESGITGGYLIGGRYPVDEHGNPVPGDWVNEAEIGARLDPPM